MAKWHGQMDQEERLERKLVKAQAELQLAQAKRAEAVTRGEQELEKVRQRSARRLDRATRRVERRAAAVSRAESRLLSLRSAGASPIETPRAAPEGSPLDTVVTGSHERGADGAVAGPEVGDAGDTDTASRGGSELS